MKRVVGEIDDELLARIIYERYGLDLHAMQVLAANRRKAHGRTARRARETLDSLSTHSLNYAAILVEPQVRWAINQRIGALRAARHRQTADRNHERLGQSYEFDDPALNRRIAVDLVARLLGPIAEELANELGNALVGLERGRIAPIVKPKSRATRGKDPEAIDTMRWAAVCHVAFRQGQGESRERAIAAVADAYGCGEETIKGWMRREQRKPAVSGMTAATARKLGRLHAGGAFDDGSLLMLKNSFDLLDVEALRSDGERWKKHQADRRRR